MRRRRRREAARRRREFRKLEDLPWCWEKKLVPLYRTEKLKSKDESLRNAERVVGNLGWLTAGAPTPKTVGAAARPA